MKRLVFLATLFLSLGGIATADIHTPPGYQYTSSRKLGRAISNILYGLVEIPEQIVRKNERYGRKAGFSYGIVDGTNRALRRFGYGWYELFTFTCPTYRGTFKQPYERSGGDHRMEMNPHDGLSEFPPELGFESYFRHSRTQKW